MIRDCTKLLNEMEGRLDKPGRCCDGPRPFPLYKNETNVTVELCSIRPPDKWDVAFKSQEIPLVTLWRGDGCSEQMLPSCSFIIENKSHAGKLVVGISVCQGSGPKINMNIYKEIPVSSLCLQYNHDGAMMTPSLPGPLVSHNGAYYGPTSLSAMPRPGTHSVGSQSLQVLTPDDVNTTALVPISVSERRNQALPIQLSHDCRIKCMTQLDVEKDTGDDWRMIAQYMGLCNDQIKWMENRKSCNDRFSPTMNIIDMWQLKGYSLEELVNFLREKGRNDVAREIEKDTKEHNIARLPLESNMPDSQPPRLREAVRNGNALCYNPVYEIPENDDVSSESFMGDVSSGSFIGDETEFNSRESEDSGIKYESIAPEESNVSNTILKNNTMNQIPLGANAAVLPKSTVRRHDTYGMRSQQSTSTASSQDTQSVRSQQSRQSTTTPSSQDTKHVRSLQSMQIASTPSQQSMQITATASSQPQDTQQNVKLYSDLVMGCRQPFRSLPGFGSQTRNKSEKENRHICQKKLSQIELKDDSSDE